MISPDVNVLVYAFRQDSVKHEECRDWLNEQIRNRNGLVLIDVVLVGFLRICTHPKIFREPSSISEATNFLSVMISNQNVRLTSSTPETWQTFSRILDKTNVQGNKHLRCVASGNIHGKKSNLGFDRQRFQPISRSKTPKPLQAKITL